MGRNRKTTAEHLRDGTLNVTEHAGRMREPSFSGAPVMPKGLPADAQKHWRQVVPELIAKGVAKAADAPALQAMCCHWAAYQKANRTRPPKEFNEQRARQLLVTGYYREWLTVASRFGLTPADRAKIEVTPGDDLSNPFEEFMRKRLGEK
jgi:phage terminase small subunit